MKNYRCPSCGKRYDPAKEDLCPYCGDPPAPGILSSIERERSEFRHREEIRRDSDPHCHEDDAWTGSYGARVHEHAPHFTQNSAQTRSQAQQRPRARARKGKQPKPWLPLLIFLIPFLLMLLGMFLSVILEVLENFY